jgi:hypothetical protein
MDRRCSEGSCRWRRGCRRPWVEFTPPGRRKLDRGQGLSISFRISGGSLLPE